MYYGDSQYAARATGSSLLRQHHVLHIFSFGADYDPVLYFNLHSTTIPAPVVRSPTDLVAANNILRGPIRVVIFICQTASGRYLKSISPLWKSVPETTRP